VSALLHRDTGGEIRMGAGLPAEEAHRQRTVARPHAGKSVTELEILHGVLNNPEAAGRSYFYLRGPSRAPEGDERAEADEQARAKLAALKERIRASGLPVREGFASPAELAEMVYEDLASAIDELFPHGSAADSLTCERQVQDAFIASQTGIYVGRDEYFGALERHLRSDDPPLVVVGGPGSAKSALLAEWTARIDRAERRRLRRAALRRCRGRVLGLGDDCETTGAGDGLPLSDSSSHPRGILRVEDAARPGVSPGCSRRSTGGGHPRWA